MDALTVDAIAALARNSETVDLIRDVVLQDGVTYTFRNNPTEYGRELGALLSPPRPATLAVSTLTGFVDALQAGSYNPNGYLVHVEDYLNVTMKERGVDIWGNRSTLLKATHIPIDAFRFDSYYSDVQKFIIAVQAAFLQTDELLYLIRLASNLKSGNSVQTQDDGYSQTITVKTGEISTAEVKVPPRIKLVPMRTFPEAAPVQSEFLIRFQQAPNTAPSIALFDVSGQGWKGQQMHAIKAWLAGRFDSGFPIIA